MPSSQRDDKIGGIARAYDQAYEALMRDDVDRVAVLLGEVQTLIGALRGDEAGTPEARLAVAQGFGRLAGALRGAVEDSRRELRKTREARRVIARYGIDIDARGSRVESEA